MARNNAGALKAPGVRKSVTIPAGATKVLDRIPLSRFGSADYFVQIKSDAQDVRKNLNLAAVKEAGPLVTDQLWGKVGDSIDAAVDTDVDGSDMVVEITNNETFELTANAVRTLFN